jgi:hypothetical protein
MRERGKEFILLPSGRGKLLSYLTAFMYILNHPNMPHAVLVGITLHNTPLNRHP